MTTLALTDSSFPNSLKTKRKEQDSIFGYQQLGLTRSFQIDVCGIEYEITGIPHTAWFEEILNTLSYFSELEYNWNNEEASPIHPDNILVSIFLLVSIVNEDTPKPYVFPTPKGGVQFEWHTKKTDLEIEIIDYNTVLVLYEGPDAKELDWEQSIFPDISKLIECIKTLV